MYSHTHGGSFHARILFSEPLARFGADGPAAEVIHPAPPDLYYLYLVHEHVLKYPHTTFRRLLWLARLHTENSKHA